MTIERIRNWSPPHGSNPDEIADWVQQHYQDHLGESVARIEDFTNEISLIDLNDLANTSLSDPDADRILFWDDSDGQYEFLTPNTLLSITGNNLNVDESSIDHNNLTNTHNLTTDIDHGSLSGLDDADHNAVYFTKTELNAVAIERTVSISATTLSLTWDGNTNTLDLTSQTSANARWAWINVYYTRNGDCVTSNFEWYKYGETTTPIASLTSDRIGSHNFHHGSSMLVPLDSEQRVQYNAPTSTSSRTVTLYAYVENLTLADLI